MGRQAGAGVCFCFLFSLMIVAVGRPTGKNFPLLRLPRIIHQFCNYFLNHLHN